MIPTQYTADCRQQLDLTIRCDTDTRDRNLEDGYARLCRPMLACITVVIQPIDFDDVELHWLTLLLFRGLSVV